MSATPPIGTESSQAAAASLVLVVDFGGQYAQLIARRVRELGAHSTVVRHDVTPGEIRELRPAAIILSGGPASVYAEDAPSFDAAIIDMGYPLFGICYGMQLLAQALGGTVERNGIAEYGNTPLHIAGGTLLDDLDEAPTVWMSHRDAVTEPPPNAIVSAHSPSAPVAAFESTDGRCAGVQFHPEVVHTPAGSTILDRFLSMSDVPRTWTPEAVIDDQIHRIREQVGDRHVLCALSGGVDSAVAAMLVYRAIGDQLTCVFVDHGLLRKEEAADVVSVFGDHFHVPLIHVDARQRFLELLSGVEDPEEKRRIIGEAFIRVFEEEALKLEASGGVDFLVQGTLYSDVIESGGVEGVAAKIKSHHNVGGLPDTMHFDLIEPLRDLFKDEVRRVGETLGLPAHMVWRQPFPGPGLAIRIIGDVTEERLEIVRESDAIVRDEVAKASLDRELWQYFTVLPAIKSVGVQGDSRTYAYPIVIRAVSSEDAMTADWARLPYDLVAAISSRIINEVEHVNRVVLDVSSKPPATIEWE